ncbi:bifunctional methylenetetrahydrofolate dehydrogenase/methenyltetrahydrofolate cyclohydrolase FolD [Alkalihalobacillus sp. MEB130]|uniref:bifunctional methylenetetrahydrofolate dehydrogenase/methenyltetrahydrofolate cyclohydrolase FolD n=1 Tax=Alkalihalobacillus sp. MEB130 TaxID=2976704 RepID=UPI0028DFF59E|nr:bifunctional methylenetetrahydrofolate dehydrogenase/methenyltetrahydrofolate cyclohydrolase FolD [Alkalihalobacillus sp. MEB130]MDT8862530.1 bifunctional methylenetetrahydrofolate dehydrogenase/methenyltetrahydrofolate cyclohydrolase FolD [Alkalihalobacillus sp. MEB130]
MTALLLNGKELASKKREQLKKDVEQLASKQVVPGLAVILVGEDPASQTYVRAKEKACEQAGIHSVLIKKPNTITEEELLAEIERLNHDSSIDGILVQLPIPEHISEQAVIEKIAPNKDVDGFHPINIGKMMTGEDTFLPCTPFGVVEMLKEAEIDIAGKHAVVVGRSNIVGKPVGQLLLNENATVTYTHSRTKNLRELTNLADILIVAIGKPEFVGAEDVKEGAVVVDVGINRVDGKLVGDVDFDSVKDKASYITPVPGGVGPMTITMLLENTVLSARKRS